jgi:hypothetical protein
MLGVPALIEVVLGNGLGLGGIELGVFSRWSGRDSWAVSSCSPPLRSMSSSVWDGPLRGWISGGEVGSPMWARICVMGFGSVRTGAKRSSPRE